MQRILYCTAQLQSDERPLNSMRWYEDLICCAATSSNIDTEHPLIVSLIPLCIEKVVLWKITGAAYIEHVVFLLWISGLLVKTREVPPLRKQNFGFE